MKVEVLYFNECPYWQNALGNLKQVLDQLEREYELSVTCVETADDAVRTRFVGSPTIRVNGHDLFPITPSAYALGCRVYYTPEGLRGWPTVEMISDALKAHQIG